MRSTSSSKIRNQTEDFIEFIIIKKHELLEGELFYSQDLNNEGNLSESKANNINIFPQKLKTSGT